MWLALLLTLSQTLTVTLKPATPFTITWDMPVDNSGPSFRLWCDGAVVKNYTPKELTKAPLDNPDGTVTYTAEAPGLSAGNHSCFVSAFNLIGEVKGEPIPLVVGVLPSTPLRLKVVITVPGGGH